MLLLPGLTPNTAAHVWNGSHEPLRNTVCVILTIHTGGGWNKSNPSQYNTTQQHYNHLSDSISAKHYVSFRKVVFIAGSLMKSKMLLFILSTSSVWHLYSKKPFFRQETWREREVYCATKGHFAVRCYESHFLPFDHVTNCIVVFVETPWSHRSRRYRSLVSVTFLILHSVATFLISRPVKLQMEKHRTNHCEAMYFEYICHLSPSLPELLRGPEALETAADSNWWYTLHQRDAATPWCAVAGLLLPARQIWRAPTHLLLTPKAVSAICSTPEYSRYLLMFDGHGHTPPWRTIIAVFHVLVH